MLNLEKIAYILKIYRDYSSFTSFKNEIANKFGNSIDEDLLERIYELLHLTINEKNGQDWGLAESELVYLITENRDIESEGIVRVFTVLADFLERSMPTVQYKYYKIKKRMDDGLTFSDAISMKRGKRGLGKRTIEKLQTEEVKEEIPLLINFDEHIEQRKTVYGEDVLACDSNYFESIVSQFKVLEKDTQERLLKLLNNIR